jgi:hypothetical protein
MKLVKSLIVLAAVIALGIFVYFKVYKVEQARKAQESMESRLVQFDIDNIKKFTLVRPDSSVTFERGVGRLWSITAPIKSEASGKQIFGLFESLNQSNIQYHVDDKPKDLRPYGLDRPAFFMAMEYDQGKPDTLFLGIDTPDKTMTYVKFASGKKVLAVNNTLTDLMKKPVRFYRSRTVLNVLPEDIRGIEITRGNDQSNRIQLDFNGVAWIMQYPWELPADLKSTEELLKKIGESNKMTLVQEHAASADLAKYGIDKPTTVLTIQLNYNMPSKMLVVGSRLTEKGRTHLWYAKQFDNDLVFTIENSLVTLLNYPPVNYIDKQPLKFDRNVVDKIELTTDKQIVVLAKDAEGKWSAVSPVDKNIQDDTINNLFSISRFIFVNDIFSVKPAQSDMAKSGIDKPKFALEFYSGQQSLGRILYGKSFTKDKIMTYFQTSLSPFIYVTDAQVTSSVNYVLEKVFGK